MDCPYFTTLFGIEPTGWYVHILCFNLEFLVSFLSRPVICISEQLSADAPLSLTWVHAYVPENCARARVLCLVCSLLVYSKGNRSLTLCIVGYFGFSEFVKKFGNLAFLAVFNLVVSRSPGLS